MQPSEHPGPQPENYRVHLDRLQSEGRALGVVESLSGDDPAVRAWQQQCATLIGQLSGGVKAHWLARAYGEAFLVSGGTADAPAGLIVRRILSVLEQASASLEHLQRIGADSSPDSVDGASSTEPFAFIADPTLRHGLADVHRAARDAFDKEAYALALVSTCSVLESVITEVVQRCDPSVLVEHDAPAGPITTWPFDTRITIAERAGCISAGCARLPSSARRYRDLLDDQGDVRSDVDVSERDARRAGQVLRVMLRDLAPGR